MLRTRRQGRNRGAWALVVATLTLAPLGAASATSPPARPTPLAAVASWSASRVAAPVIVAQDEDQGDATEVTPAEIDKYVAVYRAMHRDHSLTVEQAAARQGMSLSAFRALENRVERDDAAMEQARDQLQASAVHASPAPTVAPH